MAIITKIPLPICDDPLLEVELVALSIRLDGETVEVLWVEFAVGETVVVELVFDVINGDEVLTAVVETVEVVTVVPVGVVVLVVDIVVVAAVLG